MPGRYTFGEKLDLLRLETKAARRVIAAGDENAGGSDRAQNRIHDRAQERWEREAGHAFGQLDTAKDELARAEVALRTARGPEKTAARRARNDAAAKVRRADAAARKYR
ncbi:hypothetical protein AB0N14_13580 [Streptomyces sp. NPDC051104]|uniref:hypothetical protein n=1 Tax=Streptomyces sp. NPDC051104 TaxID=3155044 RepID=UPI003442631F